jgi:2TM domain
MARSGGLLQKSLVIHAVVFAVVVAGLFTINQDVSPDVNWVKYVAWGWGIGLVAHGTVWALWGRR